MTAAASTMDAQRKAKEISAILSETEVNLWELRELALSEGGLVNGTSFLFLVCGVNPDY